MEFEHTDNDVAIVGGGLAGLTAACYLARAGRRVTVYEGAPEPGGRASTQISDGFAFNRGAHALYSGGAASEVFKELGIRYDYAIPSGISALQHGRVAPFPTGFGALLSTSLVGVRDKLDLMRVFASLPLIKPGDVANVSIQDWIERRSSRPAVRQLIAALARPFVYSTALDLISAEVLVDKMQRSLKHPIHYIHGGWQTLVAALQRQAEQAGVHIVTGAAVINIEHTDGQVHALRLRNGQIVSASAIVIAMTARAALKLFDDGAYSPLRAVVEPLVPAHLACLDVALRRLPRPEHPVVMDIGHPLFMTAQSKFARIAPDGAALIHTFKQSDSRQASDAAQDEQDLENLLDTVQPGWREQVVRRVFLPHMEGVGALPLARTGGFAGRPGTRVPGFENAFLAGDWVGNQGFLVDASMASARAVAQQVLRLPVQAPVEAAIPA